MLKQHLFFSLTCCASVIMFSGCDEGGQDNFNSAVTAPLVADDDPTQETTPNTERRSFGEVHHGEATYYHASGEGNCSFEASDNLLVAAINTRDYSGAALCGAYVQVSGPKGMVTVRIVDRCPGCAPGGLDLSREAFEQIAELTDGRVNISWQIVAGPVSGPVVYHYMDGTTRYWTAIQVRNHRWPIASLEIMPNGSDEWLKVERRNYNYFVRSKTIAPGPLHVRITAITDERLEDQLPEPASIPAIVGKAQFP